MQLSVQNKINKAHLLVRQSWVQARFKDKKISIFLVLFTMFFSVTSHSQETLSQLLKKYNSNSVPYITVQELAMPKTEVILLDARELHEYKVSHIKNAIHIGFDDFNLKDITKHLKDNQQTIVVYCSLGIRSEHIAEQIKKEGFTNIYNLYGGIFEWKNNNFDVYDANEEVTNNVHTYSKEWSTWLLNGNKIYD